MLLFYKRSFHYLAFFFVSLFMLSSLYAGTDGTIRGQVTDIEGEPLPGAQVFIGEISLGAVADVNGNYLILNIPIGTYDVAVMMMGYQKQTIQGVEVIMDQTLWLNFAIPVEAYKGDEVQVVGEKKLVEKGTTSKKITIHSEAISTLPIRDINELYTLQSGVVKVESRNQGIPDHEERGLEEIHVRGGRTGEIAYMMDGMYIRNPIYGGIGTGTRLNFLAVKEFDWQPGGFNSEYGDAMAAVSNWHTKSGGKNYTYHLKYESSALGAALGSTYDKLRGFNDLNFGLGGPLLIEGLTFWFSAQITDKKSYRVYKFDDIIYEPLPNQNAENYLEVLNRNKSNLVQPWDLTPGYRGFGFDNTADIFTKLTYKATNRLRFSGSYWQVAAHRKGFNPRYLYWDQGKSELFRDTYRINMEINHSLSSNTFYTIRAARFIQDQFIGVRWNDNDNDGFPNWFEWRHPAGSYSDISDPDNPYIVPYTISELGDTIYYTMVDSRSGWYYGAEPGLYNWESAEEFTDLNGNGIWDAGEPWTEISGPHYNDGQWDGPELVFSLIERDGSYWLAPQMYEDYQPFLDYRHKQLEIFQDPALNPQANPLGGRTPFLGTNYTGHPYDPNYYMPTIFGGYAWNEGMAFGGHDNYYSESRVETNEFRIDLTSQLSDAYKIRFGFDYRTHKLNFYEIKAPWLGEAAFTQTFAEYWEDTGPDGLMPIDEEYENPDFGEGNGRWEAGEKFTDSNKNGKWDDYREPEEFSAYIQNTFEVPWMVINAGIRVDMVNYNTQLWADTLGHFSPGKPFYYADQNNNNSWDIGEDVGSNPGFANQKVIFTDSKWFYKISPRIGISHVITDQATFTFNYGLYYQTPVYQNIFLNTNRLDDPEELFVEADGNIGNASMNAARSQEYQSGFNVQFNRYWAYSIMAWVKKMDQMSGYQNTRSGVYKYQIFANNDFASAKGIDFTLQNRGLNYSMMLQYTRSIATGNSEHDWAASGGLIVDAPSQEFLMPFDRPHDLTFSFYSRLLLGVTGGITAFYQSGYPYTPYIFNGRDPQIDYENKYAKRKSPFRMINISFFKGIKYQNQMVSLGLTVYNAFNIVNELDVYPLTGKADDPGEYYTNYIGLPDSQHDKSGSFYDQPWWFYNPREINFFIKIDFK